MSIHISSKAWKVGGLSMAEKLVLVKLSDNASDSGKAWPSISTIATECCCSRHTVMRAIERLCEMGHISAQKALGANTKYRVHPVAQSDQSHRATSIIERPVAQSDTTGSTERHDQSLSDTGPVAQSDTNRKEPSLNHQRTIIGEDEAEQTKPNKPKARKKSTVSAGFDPVDENLAKLAKAYNCRKGKVPKAANERWLDLEATAEEVDLLVPYIEAYKSGNYDDCQNSKDPLKFCCRDLETCLSRQKFEKQLARAEEWAKSSNATPTQPRTMTDANADKIREFVRRRYEPEGYTPAEIDRQQHFALIEYTQGRKTPEEIMR